MATVVDDNLARSSAAPRWLFTAAIFSGSFLLFLVQPMLARMALPKLGGAPAVWNSAMLVYQALLLAGYAYAHFLSRMSGRTQVITHVGVLFLAGLTLPLGLYAASPPAAADPVLWVPWLLLLSVGPLFFAISAQAPLLQRWFAQAGGGDPYPLYVASNLGSFCGLLSYPLLLEPLVGVGVQSFWWSAAYGAMALLVAACALPLFEQKAVPQAQAPVIAIPWKTLTGWALIAAVPSGLMLSTTLHLTTDVAPMPLLWVIPLGLYLLSFSIAFATGRKGADIGRAVTPYLLIFASLTLFVVSGPMLVLAVLVALLAMFGVAISLHARLFDTRPAPEQLTIFYLALSVGGVLGGIFCALVAPLIFDWTYEHVILILAAAALLGDRQPLQTLADFSSRPAVRRGLSVALGLLAAATVALFIADKKEWLRFFLPIVSVLAAFVLGYRWIFTGAVALALALGGTIDRVVSSFTPGEMTRSYFGVYRVIGNDSARALVHGTTTHGVQLLGSAERRRTPTSYYWSGTGVGRVAAALPSSASVGVVGLGIGTLSCYAKPGQRWTLFEIDPAVIGIARSPAFSFLRDCLPDAPIVVGDARLRLAELPPGQFDVLIVDAFSSDAIPVHLLTREAFAVYTKVLKPGGTLLVHISNRHLDLRPVMVAGARSFGMAALEARSTADAATEGAPSLWIAMTGDPAQRQRIVNTDTQLWRPMDERRPLPWTDDHASILPALKEPW